MGACEPPNCFRLHQSRLGDMHRRCTAIYTGARRVSQCLRETAPTLTRFFIPVGELSNKRIAFRNAAKCMSTIDYRANGKVDYHPYMTALAKRKARCEGDKRRTLGPSRASLNASQAAHHTRFLCPTRYDHGHPVSPSTMPIFVKGVWARDIIYRRPNVLES